jgi:hypothetical protein
MNKCPTLGSLESDAVLELNVVLREAYNNGMLQVQYFLKNIRFILLYVEFEDGLSISVLKKRATHHKNSQLEIVKF